ncbi:hypothetical protein FH972_002306 [Carpinus fangiana]|uniref:Uncharacterized protein n=1 Tax=Carpinus fangiana TaxID=176857 RepID=A0A5N6QEF9_9ROSI|nr:hypothetical protein FH972_002306 [Carpinus fangiana]
MRRFQNKTEDKGIRQKRSLGERGGLQRAELREWRWWRWCQHRRPEQSCREKPRQQCNPTGEPPLTPRPGSVSCWCAPGPARPSSRASRSRLATRSVAGPIGSWSLVPTWPPTQSHRVHSQLISGLQASLPVSDGSSCLKPVSGFRGAEQAAS